MGVAVMNNEYLELKRELIDFIRLEDASDDMFNEMALKVFCFQYEYNQAYQKFCRKRKISPRNVKHFTGIPAVPIDAFKATSLSCHPIDSVEAVFMTSGTTNPEKKGKNFHRDLDVYDVSMKRNFKPFLLPDTEKIKMFVLFPTEKELPNSSLAHYLYIAKEAYGTKDSLYAFSDDGFDIDNFLEILKEAEQVVEPILIIGATFSFIHLLDVCKERKIQFRLPEGSRIMDTGGAKGRSREMEPKQFREMMAELFSIPTTMCVNMYGMTELSSQFYDNSLVKKVLSSAKQTPHWVRTYVVDSVRMERKEKGEVGIIVHYDLANLNSLLAVLTEDLGREEADTFYLLGRAKGAEAKGCSLAVEQFLLANEDKGDDDDGKVSLFSRSEKM